MTGALGCGGGPVCRLWHSRPRGWGLVPHSPAAPPCPTALWWHRSAAPCARSSRIAAASDTEEGHRHWHPAPKEIGTQRSNAGRGRVSDAASPRAQLVSPSNIPGRRQLAASLTGSPRLFSIALTRTYSVSSLLGPLHISPSCNRVWVRGEKICQVLQCWCHSGRSGAVHLVSSQLGPLDTSPSCRQDSIGQSSRRVEQQATRGDTSQHTGQAAESNHVLTAAACNPTQPQLLAL